MDKNIKELDNFIEGLNIENNYHNKIFEDNTFEQIYTKINLENYNQIKNRIYWLSLLIYRVSLVNYLKNINNDIDLNKNIIKIEKKNLIIFHPATNITSEICKLLRSSFIYPSLV